MADDIVKRLRAEADAHADGDWNDQVIRRRFTEAADEIERLRAIAEFATHSDGCEQPWHGIKRVCTCGLMELWEARRGLPTPWVTQPNV